MLVKLGKELVHNLYENYSGLDDNKQFAKTICEELKLDVNKWLDMKVIPAMDYTPIKTTENIDEAVWSEAEIGVKRIIRLFGSALKEMNIRSDLKEKEKAILQYIEEDAVIEKGEEMAVEFEKTNTDQAALEMITSLTKKVTQLEKLTKNQSVKEGRGANNNSASLKKQKAKKLAEKKARAKAKKEKARNQRSNSQERRNSDTASSNDTNNGNSSSNNRNKNRNRNNGNNQGNRSRSRQQKK
ncbi:MAG: hypothetical protein GY874_07440 [Desulfobacteraceae bacterium]|nr:hypothetical protein [Desulfobacteraceae bacterium]